MPKQIQSEHDQLAQQIQPKFLAKFLNQNSTNGRALQLEPFLKIAEAYLKSLPNQIIEFTHNDLPLMDFVQKIYAQWDEYQPQLKAAYYQYDNAFFDDQIKLYHDQIDQISKMSFTWLYNWLFENTVKDGDPDLRQIMVLKDAINDELTDLNQIRDHDYIFSEIITRSDDWLEDVLFRIPHVWTSIPVINQMLMQL